MNGFTIKDQFRQWRKDLPYDVPQQEVEINATIKPVDREDANAEIEKNELVLLEDGKLFKALGKRHSEGGTPVNLPKNTFIYSDYKPLAIAKEDKEIFKFKSGGKSKEARTPAKVAMREVDIKHHNKMLAILQDPKEDFIAKNSAEQMLNKNFKKLGQVAYLQEEAKGFPTGVPKHAAGTAPLENKNEFMQQQFKKGGYYQQGKNWEDLIPTAKKVDVSRLPRLGTIAGKTYHGEMGSRIPSRGTSDFSLDRAMQPNSPYKTFRRLATPLDAQGRQQLFNQWNKGYRGFSTLEYTEAGEPVTVGKPDDAVSLTPQGNGIPLTGTFDSGITWKQPEVPAAPSSKKDIEDDVVVLPYEPNVRLSPQQKANLGYAAFNQASIRRFNPKMTQMTFNDVELQERNFQPTENALQVAANMSNEASRLLRTPAAQAMQSATYGNYLDRRSQASGENFNVNNQIRNQQAMYNNQGRNRVANMNAELAGRYFDNVQRVNQNYDREQAFGRNKFISLKNAYDSQNDALELQLASQRMYSKDMYQAPDGKLITPEQFKALPLQDRARFKMVKQAAPAMDYNNRTNKVYFTGVNADFNNVNAANNPLDALISNLIQQQASGNISKEDRELLGNYLRGAALRRNR